MFYSKLFGSDSGSQMPTQTAMDVENSVMNAGMHKKITLRALYSKMILEALPEDKIFSPDTLEIDGKPVTNITMVGKVLEIIPENGSKLMRVLDDVGEIWVRLWNAVDEGNDKLKKKRKQHSTSTIQQGKHPKQHDGDDMIIEAADGHQEYFDDEETIREGSYIRVYGHLRNEKGKPVVVAFSARIIEDHNEVTHHTLEVMKQHVKLTRGPLEATQPQDNIMKEANSMFGTPGPKPHGGVLKSQTASPMSIAGTPYPNSQLLEAIKSLFRNDDSEVGLHIDEVVQNLGGANQKAEVKKALDTLVVDGKMYTTTSEEHYQWCG